MLETPTLLALKRNPGARSAAKVKGASRRILQQLQWKAFLMQRAKMEKLHTRPESFLPRNNALEYSIGHAISSNHDARAMLHFTQHFLDATLISLASPISKTWDPFDMKPQVFAMDTYLALPVFTSIEYLQIFCKAHAFHVRDPSGTLWADGRDAPTETYAQTLTIPVSHLGEQDDAAKEDPVNLTFTTCSPAPSKSKRPEHTYSAAQASLEEEQSNTAEHLFDLLESTDAYGANEADRKKPKVAKRQKGVASQHSKRQGRQASKRAKAGGGTGRCTGETAEEPAATQQRQHHSSFWQSVGSVDPLNFRKVTPLFGFGSPVHPFFIGYFADVDTLLQNTSIVSEKVDIIVNPSSPMEFILAREATDAVLHREQLILRAFQGLEKALQGEFHRFFACHCPEVKVAGILCFPKPVGSEQTYNEMSLYDFEVAMPVKSDHFDTTLQRLKKAKHSGYLLGHTALDIFPWEGAAAFVQEGARVFYQRENATKGNFGHVGRYAMVYDQGKPDEGIQVPVWDKAYPFGKMQAASQSTTISVVHGAESYYHDPSNAYTESHALFPELLRTGGLGKKDS